MTQIRATEDSWKVFNPKPWPNAQQEFLYYQWTAGIIMPHGSGGNNMARFCICVLCSLVFSCRLKCSVCTRSEHGSKLLYPLFPLSCQGARRHSPPGSAGLLYNSSTLTHSTDLSPHAEIEATQLLTFPGLCIQSPMMPRCCSGALHPADQPLVIHFLHCFTHVLYLITYSDRLPCYFED